MFNNHQSYTNEHSVSSHLHRAERQDAPNQQSPLRTPAERYNTNHKLVMNENITPHPQRLIQPQADSPHILIIGAGVIGLVTAWALLDRGYKVTVLSKGWANVGQNHGDRLTSQIAGALWEFPPAVCGSHIDAVSLEYSKHWCMTAYWAWKQIADDAGLSREAGVRMTQSNFFFPQRLSDENDKCHKLLNKMMEIAGSGVEGFRHAGAKLAEERGVNPKYEGGIVDGYELSVPVIDTDLAMHWLTNLVLSKGATMTTRTIEKDLLLVEQDLRNEFHADAIVNATGLHGGALSGDDSCSPLRGALLRVVNDGTTFPKVNAALSISADVSEDNEIIFIVPRTDNILLIGGIAQDNQWDLDLTLDTPVVQRMRERANEFLPGLKNAKLDPAYPLAQGLRPARSKNVRVERELRRSEGAESSSRIVHCYGHGGSGWSLSFGCAADVIDLLDEAIEGKEPEPMNYRI
ncbi:FAD dependent oxidoreductase [Roridomyces roridus]|uniref:FAD dependent oxidoreductase n=1 Tax=Roridomyces roridus TaxID=1738132 RepID=A0AAD7FH67_9AGAR|nr:FAD dependent oxidoreductase [Roridomyces roridus]